MRTMPKMLALCMSAMILLPVWNAGLAQSAPEYQQPYGDQGGQPYLLEIPEGAVVREVAVYLNSDQSVSGLEMRYEREPGGERTATNLVGRRVGEPLVLTFDSTDRLLELELGYISGRGLTNFVIAFDKGATGLAGQPNTTGASTKSLAPGEEFAGLTIMADNERIYALGLISRPAPGGGATAEPEAPWGNNQRQAALDETPPWARNDPPANTTSAPPQSTGRPSDAPWQTSTQSLQQPPWSNETQPPASPSSDGWGNEQGQPVQGSWEDQSSQQPWDNNQQPQQPPWTTDQSPVAQAPTQQSSTPPWQQRQPASQASTPPWQTGNSQQHAGNSSTGRFGQATNQVANVSGQYLGVWVESSKPFRRDGDGIDTPEVWTAPRTILLAPSGQSGMILRYHEKPEIFTTLTKQSDTNYSGGGVTVTFSKSGTSQYARISGSNADLGGTFEPARVADGVLSSERFSPAARGDRDSRRGLFNQSGLTSEWNNNFYSYDGLEMDLFDYLRGRKVQIFKQPDSFDYAIDDNLNLGLPYGLRGYNTPRSTSRQTEALITNASTYQKSMSVNFGSALDTPKGGFSSKTSYEKTTGTRDKSSALNAIGIARIERYVLVLDKPNMVLADGFRRDLESFINNPANPQNIIRTYGSHYANAITYGGLGKAEKTMNSQQIGSYVSEKITSQQSVSFKGATLDGGFSSATSSSNSNESVFTQDDFLAVGGSGSMSASGWTVSDRDTVPVRYDLRPLSDLLSPLYFPSKGDVARARKVNAARAKLSDAVTAHMASGPAFSDENIAPRLYRVEIHSLRCLDKGHDPSNSISVFGKIAMIYHDDGGVRTIDLFDKPEPVPLFCNNSSSNRGMPLGQKVTIIASRNTEESRLSGFASLMIFPIRLTEADDGVFDPHDPIEDPRGNDVQVQLSTLANGQKRFLTFGTGEYAPTLRLEYTVTELK